MAPQVNRLVLVNNSKRPLLLLAGEIVTGGKQDRVIGKDRIVPAESDPMDLSVFCVEPGRWVATSEHFGASEALYGGARRNSAKALRRHGIMVQPSVRAKAMGDKNQQEVWDAVNTQKEAIASRVSPAAAPVAAGCRRHQFLRQGQRKLRKSANKSTPSPSLSSRIIKA